MHYPTEVFERLYNTFYCPKIALTTNKFELEHPN